MVYPKRVAAAAIIFCLAGGLPIMAKVAAVKRNEPLGKKVQEVKTKEDYDALVKSGKPVIVKFYADWCGACKTITKPFEELADDVELQGVTFAVVDIDRIRPEKIESVPAVFYFQDGQKVHHSVGGGRNFANDVRLNIPTKFTVKEKEPVKVVEEPKKPAEKKVAETVEVPIEVAQEEAVVADADIWPGGYEEDLYAAYDIPAVPAAEAKMPVARDQVADQMMPAGYEYGEPYGAGIEPEYAEMLEQAYADEALYEQELPYDYEVPAPMPKRVAERRVAPAQQPAPAPAAEEEESMLDKVQIIVRYTIDLIGDIVSATWTAIKGLFGK